MLDEFLFKATIAIIAICFIAAGGKILNFYLLRKFAKQKAYEKISRKEIELQEEKKAKKQIELEDILRKSESQFYYLQARDLFHDLMQQQLLNHEQILFLKDIVNESLGDYLKNYAYHYKNDAHEIYSKLKSSHISIDNFKKIIRTMKAFEAANASTKDDIITKIKIH